ncbi:MAG: hypothetical protein AAF745_02120, partial [Planctomycetota bacterium]
MDLERLPTEALPDPCLNIRVLPLAEPDAWAVGRDALATEAFWFDSTGSSGATTSGVVDVDSD